MFFPECSFEYNSDDLLCLFAAISMAVFKYSTELGVGWGGGSIIGSSMEFPLTPLSLIWHEKKLRGRWSGRDVSP